MDAKPFPSDDHKDAGHVAPQVEAQAPQVEAQAPQVESQALQVEAPVPLAEAPVPLAEAPAPQTHAPMGFFIVTGMQAYPGTEPYMSLKVFFGTEPPNTHSQPLVALALHADGTLAYGLPGLEPGGGDEESMEDDSALESDDEGDGTGVLLPHDEDGTGVSLPHDEDGDDDDDDDNVVIVYERLVQG